VAVVVVGGAWLHVGLPCWPRGADARLGLKKELACNGCGSRRYRCGQSEATNAAARALKSRACARPAQDFLVSYTPLARMEVKA